MNDKQKHILLIVCLSLLLIIGVMSFQSLRGTNIVYVFENRPLSKASPFENYSNDEVRSAINYSVKYINNPDKLMELDSPAWIQWLDYESRVDNASYNFWLICYCFNI